ncbi:MAG: type II toxin-antitoxin system VapB family antitoxin [Shinella sp.]|nr:type II toxin-antitoxin system VapB family antitoxin [Shinella sp.]
MPLNIKDEATHRLARRLAEQTGETLTKAVRVAIEERMQRLGKAERAARIAEELNRIGLECAALPVFDDRSPDEIIGYDENGLPS